MSWKRYDGSFPGYGYQSYGTSRFGGNILWVKFISATVRWDVDAPYEVDLSDDEVYLSDEHIFLLSSSVWKVNWNREW